VGQTGEKLPGSKALWSSVDHASEQHDNRHTTLESRLQITSWLRLIDRLETSTGDDRNASGASSTEHRLFENRFEIRPRGGLVTIRFLTGRDKSSEIIENKRKETTDSRLSSEWTHIWGRGWQSYAALEVQRSSDHHPLPMRSWSPQIQGTYHHSKWDLNASLRLKYTYQESYNRQEPPYFRYIDREMNISSTLDLRPHQILGLKIVHSLICPRGKNWDHNLKIRLMIRA